MRYVFLTYASPAFRENARKLAESASAVGFHECLVTGPADIEGTAFCEENKAILALDRGGGYWLWKPYVIARTLASLSPGDILFYCDAGRDGYYQFTRFPTRLIARAQATSKGFLLSTVVPHLGPISQWTKRDCLILMGADDEQLRSRPSLQNSLSIWTPTAAAKDFLEKWLDTCRDPRCLTDQPNTCGLPNYPEFRDHRHDQSILSILTYQTNAPHLDFSRTLTHRLIEMRPRSSLSMNFYKRPQNLDDLLRGDNPLVLVAQYFRLRSSR